ncbi:hypothetical protein OSTOST_15416 [Ostertagia ostertagi]
MSQVKNSMKTFTILQPTLLKTFTWFSSEDERENIQVKANKNAKRVIMEQQAQPSKDQQVATMGYNPRSNADRFRPRLYFDDVATYLKIDILIGMKINLENHLETNISYDP